MKRIEIQVLDPKQEQAQLLNWAAQIDQGLNAQEASPKLTFASYKTLHSLLTDKRMALLEFVANTPNLSIRQLAALLERDYKNVYDDVQRLVSLGLIEVKDGNLHVPFDEIDIRKTLRPVKFKQIA